MVNVFPASPPIISLSCERERETRVSRETRIFARRARSRDETRVVIIEIYAREIPSTRTLGTLFPRFVDFSFSIVARRSSSRLLASAASRLSARLALFFLLVLALFLGNDDDDDDDDRARPLVGLVDVFVFFSPRLLTPNARAIAGASAAPRSAQSANGNGARARASRVAGDLGRRDVDEDADADVDAPSRDMRRRARARTRR